MSTSIGSPDGPDRRTEGLPDRLAMFLFEQPDDAATVVLAAVLRRLGFDVHVAAEQAPELVLDTEHATYAIFSLTGSAGRGAIAQPPDDGSRLPAPGAYAVLMPGVGALDAPDGVGTIQLDGDGRWLDTIVGWLLEMGSSWHWHPSVRSRSSSGQNAR